MSSEARVNFTESGSQQLVSAFKSVGSSAQSSAQQVTANGSAIKQLGSGMKTSAAGIGQVATAFATLSLSIVGTYRAYRDLTDAQLQVDRANLKVKKTEEAIAKLKKEITAEQKVGTKGGLDYAIAQNKIHVAEQKLAADRKDHKHTNAQLLGEELAITKAKQDAAKGSATLGDKENKLAILEEQLGIATTNAKEQQERFNDVQQNFYLSIAPLAISTVGTLATAFGGLKGALTGGGGIVGALGPIGIGLTAISLGILAFKTNFLGIKDVIGGVITWVKDRLGIWKQGFEDVFSFIRKGDIAGAFNRIKIAAAKLWDDLVKSNPLFGGINQILVDIRNGDWKGAFSMITKGAIAAWESLKKSVPFFAGVQLFVDDIKNGKWGDAWAVVAKGALLIKNITN